MQVSQSFSAGSGTLGLAGRFDFNSHRDFRDAYETLLKTEGIRTLEVNLSRVEYLDSSALGMLLLLRERATERNVTISLTGCTGTVKQILEIANFNKIFTMNA